MFLRVNSAFENVAQSCEQETKQILYSEENKEAGVFLQADQINSIRRVVASTLNFLSYSLVKFLLRLVKRSSADCIVARSQEVVTTPELQFNSLTCAHSATLLTVPAMLHSQSAGETTHSDFR